MKGDRSGIAVAPGVYGARYVFLVGEEPEPFTIEDLGPDHPARALGCTCRIVTTAFDGAVEEYGLYAGWDVAEIVRDALVERSS
jgi:hypothetical protein